MRVWLGIKDPTIDIKIYLLKFLEHFFAHKIKMLSILFVIYALLPHMYKHNIHGNVYVLRYYLHKPETVIVILVYFAVVHVINGILLDRTWADFWDQFKQIKVISGNKELKKRDQKNETKLEKTGQNHGFKTSYSLRNLCYLCYNLCYPILFTFYVPIALINAIIQSHIF